MKRLSLDFLPLEAGLVEPVEISESLDGELGPDELGIGPDLGGLEHELVEDGDTLGSGEVVAWDSYLRKFEVLNEVE